LSTLTVQVCSCCALTQGFIAEAIGRLKAEFGARLEVEPKKCLDICQDGAVKIGEEMMVVTEAQVGTFEAKVRAALG
jgi:hypothetical protein